MRRAVWFLWLIALTGLLAVSGCGDSNDNVAEELDIDRSGFTAYFDLTAGILPFPSNLLFSGTEDGTLNIPVDDPDDFSDPKVAMNALDGFSTIAPISTTFSSAIDPATLTADTVRVFEVTLSGIGGGVTAITGELNYGTEFVATVSTVDSSGSTLVIMPLAPLDAGSSYLVMLSDGIRSTRGMESQTSAHYLIAKTPNSLIGTEAEALEPIRQLVNAQEAALAAADVDTDSVILSWTFSTQSVGVVLNKVRENATGSSDIQSTLGTTAQLLGAGPGIANVFGGTLTVPYYLSNADNFQTDPLTEFWRGPSGNFLTAVDPDGELIPGGTATPVTPGDGFESIPLLVSIPNELSEFSKPVQGWPTVIFQHGITSDRTALLAAADTLAAAGFAAVAIDLPLHGLAPSSQLYVEGLERTFDLDLVDNTTGAQGPDGVADSSGTHFINLSSLLTTRDNVRQAVADLFALKAALETMDYNGGGADFDTDNIFFVGHSLGAMVGTSFLALEPDIKSAVLGMPGGGIAKLLDGSATFGPRVAAGLAAQGVEKGTTDYESFMGAAQTVIDSADPLNYASPVGNPNEEVTRGLLLFEVIGDQVVPNNVVADAPEGTVPAPLSGTDPLAFFMGLQPVSSSTSGTNLQAQMRFTAGDHSSLLDPASSLEATSVMQGAMATFLATDGATIAISDESVLQ